MTKYTYMLTLCIVKDTILVLMEVSWQVLISLPQSLIKFWNLLTREQLLLGTLCSNWPATVSSAGFIILMDTDLHCLLLDIFWSTHLGRLKSSLGPLQELSSQTHWPRHTLLSLPTLLIHLVRPHQQHSWVTCFTPARFCTKQSFRSFWCSTKPM